MGCCCSASDARLYAMPGTEQRAAEIVKMCEGVSVSEAKVGVCKVVGRVYGSGLVSPISGRRCACYMIEIMTKKANMAHGSELNSWTPGSGGAGVASFVPQTTKTTWEREGFVFECGDFFVVDSGKRLKVSGSKPFPFGMLESTQEINLNPDSAVVVPAKCVEFLNKHRIALPGQRNFTSLGIAAVGGVAVLGSDQAKLVERIVTDGDLAAVFGNVTERDEIVPATAGDKLPDRKYLQAFFDAVTQLVGERIFFANQPSVVNSSIAPQITQQPDATALGAGASKFYFSSFEEQTKSSS